MQIFQLDPQIISSLPYLNPAPNKGGVVRRRLDIESATVDVLPDGIDALLVTSDLQGRELTVQHDPGRLMGCAVADHLAKLSKAGRIPASNKIGVLLCGDLYSVELADRRGGIGDVTSVWRSFAEQFAWVVGVVGNHDAFSDKDLDDFKSIATLEKAVLLDGEITHRNNMIIGGVGGIAGKLSKPNRKDSDTFIGLLDSVLTKGCDLLLMHESPATFGVRRGNSDITEYLELAGEVYADRRPLVFSGHTYWEHPLVTLQGGIQVLNVDSRTILLHEANLKIT